MLMGLRLDEGVDLAELATRFALPPAALCDPAKLAFHASHGLTWRSGDRIGVTDTGMVLLDALLGELIPGELVS
jgi:oxygen-independent coproporphyrinogen-3 oxidase